MTPDIKAIKAAADRVKGWSNCDKAWLDTSEDESAAMFGAICEEGVRYPVATVDCDQYMQGEDSLPLAKFYAAANPATVISLCDEIERMTTIASELQDLCDMQAKRLAEAEKDAERQFRDVERYRFLRDMDHWPAVFTSSNSPEPTRGNELDECIDKEIESKT